MVDERGVARFEDARSPSDDDVDTAVGTLLHQRVPAEKIPLLLANTRGFDPADVERAIARAQDVERGRETRRWRAAVAVSVAAVAVGTILDATMGSSRALGAALLMATIALTSTLVVWLLRFHK